MTQQVAAYWEDQISGRKLSGLVVNSHYCAVRDKWILLVVGDDTMFHSVEAEGIGVSAGYWVDRPVEEGEEDEE